MLFLYFYYMNTCLSAGFIYFCMFMFYHHWNNCGVWKSSVDIHNCSLKQQNISTKKSVYISFSTSFPSDLEI